MILKDGTVVDQDRVDFAIKAESNSSKSTQWKILFFNIKGAEKLNKLRKVTTLILYLNCIELILII